MYLLDADWIIEALGNRQPAARELELLAASLVYVSYITVGEVYERAFVFPNPDAHLVGFRRFLAPYDRITLSDAVMERFAETRAYLRRRGELIADMDLLVAATAMAYDLTVLTSNLRHFERIPDLKIYRRG